MKNNFGTFLLNLRKEKNLSRKDLANLSGISNIQIFNLEHGKCKPHIKTIYILSKALNCNYEILIKLAKEDRKCKN